MVKRYLDIGTVCSAGLKRPDNQDGILALVGEIHNSEFGVFAVADGIGGMAFGEAASGFVIVSIVKWWEARIKEIISMAEINLLKQVDMELEDLIHKLNKGILEYCKNHDQRGGTTLSLIFIFNNSYIIKHTGDSRIYMFADCMIQLTKDQSWIEREVERGTLTREEGDVNPMKHILTTCLGVFEEPEILTISGELPKSGIIMLCSDGLYGYFDFSELESMISLLKKDDRITAQCIANELVNKVILEGAHDNISLVILNLKDISFFKYINGLRENTANILRRLIGFDL